MTKDLAFTFLQFGRTNLDGILIPGGATQLVSVGEDQAFSLVLFKGSVVVSRVDKEKPFRQVTGGPLSPVILTTPGTYSIFAKSHTVGLRVERG